MLFFFVHACCMVLRSAATSSLHPVAACTCSTVTPSAISVRVRPLQETGKEGLKELKERRIGLIRSG